MNTKRKVLAAVMLLAACVLHAQARPRLAILPFTGGGADGDTLALLLGNEPDLHRAFTVVPRGTGGVDAIVRGEHRFQRSGLTDSDTIAQLGRQMNVDYVVAGHIQQLGARRLVHITVVNVESFQQIAGDFREYGEISEMIGMLPEMARRIAAAPGRAAARLPGLAVLPFYVMSGAVNQGDAEVLAQLLATEIANSGSHAVLPRTSTLERVMAEHAIQRGGMTDPANIRRLGVAANAEYVLAGTVTSLGDANLFVAQILHVESGVQIAGGHEQYREVGDGIARMQALSVTLASDCVKSAKNDNDRDIITHGFHKRRRPRADAASARQP